jgi:hypothetical protein
MRRSCMGIVSAALVAFAAGASAQDGSRISIRLEPAPGLLGEIWGDADFRSRDDDARFRVKVRGVEPGTPLRLLVGGIEVASLPSDRRCSAQFAFRTEAGPGDGGGGNGGGDGNGGNGPAGTGNGDGDDGGNGGGGDLPGSMELRCIRTRGDFGSGGGRGAGWQPLDFDPRGQLVEVATGEMTLLSGTLGPDDSFEARIDEVVCFDAPAGGGERSR